MAYRSRRTSYRSRRTSYRPRKSYTRYRASSYRPRTAYKSRAYSSAAAPAKAAIKQLMEGFGNQLIALENSRNSSANLLLQRQAAEGQRILSSLNPVVNGGTVRRGSPAGGVPVFSSAAQ